MLSSIIALMFVLLPACEYEDSPNCSWDAQTAGINGAGESFVDIGGTAYYVDAQPEPAAQLVSTKVIPWDESDGGTDPEYMEYRVIPEWMFHWNRANQTIN